eukprot:CAMPEP_0178408112 /NCGR_PEP_ID=MMETSP0689_2-20121128/19772_1 /TAXON_ID=160604 /ORGANISM="Amphidinium massartii, Strain CS-259" /LENGTH=40 /DNA_ID= /DNA_START= /DNA_END= /DNA_ORIENTATION=
MVSDCVVSAVQHRGDGGTVPIKPEEVVRASATHTTGVVSD